MRTTLVRRMLAATLLAGLLGVSAAGAQKTDEPEVLLQAAQAKQLVEGQLEDAIQIYKRILQQYPGNRTVAAQALLEMGRCYEKLGNTEARKAYERLLREYGDQDEAAAEARARLAALSGSTAPTGSEMVNRRVWSRPDTEKSLDSLSPDGRYLATKDSTTGDVVMRDLVTGKMRRLTQEVPPLHAEATAISRDGKEVAYVLGNYKEESSELRLTRLDGSAQRVLYRGKHAYAVPADWSPDGKYILAEIDRAHRSWQIALISVADGSLRVLKTLDWFTTRLKFSSDGRYIAYDFPQQKGSGNRDIFLLAADGSGEIRAVEHPADDQLVGWTPDGNHILFASDRSGSMDLWMVRVVDGRAQGAPELVRPNIGQMIPLGFTRAGAFYYEVATGTSDVYTAEFDPATGKVVSEPQNATQRFIGSNSSPAWSPDGQYLAYISRNRDWRAGQRPEIITIRSLKTGEERELSPKLSYIWGPVRWSPDGRSVLVEGKDWKIRHGAYLVDAQTAEVTPLQSEDMAIGDAALFPDGKRLLYGIAHNEAGTITQSVEIRDLATGRQNVLLPPAAGVTIDDVALSPDGRQVAITVVNKDAKSSALKVMAVAGGDAAEIVSAKEPETIVGDSLSWSPDSRYIIFGRARTAGEEHKTDLLAVPAQGGEPHRLGVDMAGVHNVSFHPDGRHMAFQASVGFGKIEVWVMENFLPTPKAARQPR
jgi:Tol biopolymer transport system component